MAIDSWRERLVRWKEAAIPYVAIVTVQLLFASNAIISKIGMEGENFPPILFASFRSLIAFPCMLTYAYFTNDMKLPTIPREAYKTFFWLGFFGIFGNQVGNLYGLSLTSPTVSGIMMPSTAVWTMAISIGLKRETSSKLKLVGVLCAIIGSCIVILFPSKESAESDSDTGIFVLGVCLLLVNTLSYAIYLVMQKPLLKDYAPYTIGTYTFVVGGSVTFLASLYHYATTDFARFSVKTWLAVTYAGVAASAIPYFLTLWAMKRSNPSVAAIFSTLQPVGVSLMAFIWQGTVITAAQICGGLCIICGLCLTVFSQSQIDKKNKQIELKALQLVEEDALEEEQEAARAKQSSAVLSDRV